MNVNSQYFDKEQIKSGEMQKLLDFLMSEAYGNGNHYNDIHIYPADCGAFIVEWVQIPWDHSYGGHFEYIDETQVVMTEKVFPDNHYEYFQSEEEYSDRLEEWLKENEGWVKTSYGTWTNEIENAAMKEFFDNIKADKNTESQKEVHFENGVPQGE